MPFATRKSTGKRRSSRPRAGSSHSTRSGRLTPLSTSSRSTSSRESSTAKIWRGVNTPSRRDSSTIETDRSLSNLDLDSIDLYYVHNPETQLAERSAEAVYDQLEATFTRLEERVADGDIRHYGVATWEAFRVPADHDSYLSLPEVVRRAGRRPMRPARTRPISGRFSSRSTCRWQTRSQ